MLHHLAHPSPHFCESPSSFVSFHSVSHPSSLQINLSSYSMELFKVRIIPPNQVNFVVTPFSLICPCRRGSDQYNTSMPSSACEQSSGVDFLLHHLLPRGALTRPMESHGSTAKPDQLQSRLSRKPSGGLGLVWLEMSFAWHSLPALVF